MEDLTGRGFGLLIAYILPGIIALVGVSPYSPLLQSWLQSAGNAETGLAGFLHLTALGTAVGLVLGCVRWAVLDSLNERTGLCRPRWDDRRLGERLPAFNLLVEHHYRYYQFYGSMLLALPIGYTVQRLSGSNPLLGTPSDLLMLAIEAILLAGARDALRNYYARTLMLLGSVTQNMKEFPMTNGSHHEESAAPSNTNAPTKGKAPRPKNTPATKQK